MKRCAYAILVMMGVSGVWGSQIEEEAPPPAARPAFKQWRGVISTNVGTFERNDDSLGKWFIKVNNLYPTYGDINLPAGPRIGECGVKLESPIILTLQQTQEEFVLAIFQGGADVRVTGWTYNPWKQKLTLGDEDE